MATCYLCHHCGLGWIRQVNNRIRLCVSKVNVLLIDERGCLAIGAVARAAFILGDQVVPHGALEVGYIIRRGGRPIVGNRAGILGGIRQLFRGFAPAGRKQKGQGSDGKDRLEGAHGNSFKCFHSVLTPPCSTRRILQIPASGRNPDLRSWQPYCLPANGLRCRREVAGRHSRTPS